MKLWSCDLRRLRRGLVRTAFGALAVAFLEGAREGKGEAAGEGLLVEGVAGKKRFSMFSRSALLRGWPLVFVPR